MKSQNVKILLIEDDIVLGDSISDLLVLSNFEVTWLKDGVEALFYLKNNVPDIIISDLMMPIMSGEELFLKIRKNSKYNTIPFMIITANMDNEIKFKQLKNGVNDFIMKPFKIIELIYKINNIIHLKRNFEKKYSPDPFSKITIKLSKKDFITSVNEVLIKNIKSKIDMDKLCSELFMSKSTLDKKIRKLANKNASKYVREFRLDYAVKLMNAGEQNIQFLVDESGFSSFSYFSTSFKSYLNSTPRDFIKSIQKEKQSLL